MTLCSQKARLNSSARSYSTCLGLGLRILDLGRLGLYIIERRVIDTAWKTHEGQGHKEARRGSTP